MSTNQNAHTKLLYENKQSTTTKTCVQVFVSAKFICSSPSIVAERMEWHKVREGCVQNEITALLLCILNSPKKCTTVNTQQYTQKKRDNKSTTLQEHVSARQTSNTGKRQSKHADVNMLFFASGIQYPSKPVTGT